MKQHKILWLAIVVLFALNAVTLCIMLMKKEPRQGPPGKHRFDRLVIETLKLDDKQISQFDDLKREHRSRMNRLDDSMHTVYESYFAMLNTTASATVKDSFEAQISMLYLRKVQITYAHFAALKAICTPEQQKRFSELEPHLMQVIAPPPKKN